MRRLIQLGCIFAMAAALSLVIFLKMPRVDTFMALFGSVGLVVVDITAIGELKAKTMQKERQDV